MKGRTVAIQLILSILVLCRVSFVADVDSRVDFKKYENKTLGITINYPKKWKISESNYLVTFSIPSDSFFEGIRSTLSISVADWSQRQLTLDEFTLLYINQSMASGMGNYVIESTRTTLGNIPAHKYVYECSNLRYFQIWTIKDTKAYVITFVAKKSFFSEYQEIIQEVIDSFRFIQESQRASLTSICKQKGAPYCQ